LLKIKEKNNDDKVLNEYFTYENQCSNSDKVFDEIAKTDTLIKNKYKYISDDKCLLFHNPNDNNNKSIPDFINFVMLLDCTFPQKPPKLLLKTNVKNKFYCN